MTREEAHKRCLSKDCFCACRDSNYHKTIDKSYDYFDIELVKLKLEIAKLNNKLKVEKIKNCKTIEELDALENIKE